MNLETLPTRSSFTEFLSFSSEIVVDCRKAESFFWQSSVSLSPLDTFDAILLILHHFFWLKKLKYSINIKNNPLKKAEADLKVILQKPSTYMDTPYSYNYGHGEGEKM